MDNNMLTGKISPKIGNLKNLRFLYPSGFYFRGFNYNQITGVIPEEIGNATELSTMYNFLLIIET